MNVQASTPLPPSSSASGAVGRAQALAKCFSAVRTWGNKIPFRRKLALMGILVTGLVLLLQAAGWLGPVERRVYDYRARFCQSRVPLAAQYVHLDIDDGSVETIARWPWPRRVIGDVLRLISDAGAKTVAIDVMFSEKEALDPDTSERLPADDVTPDDESFAEAMQASTQGPGKTRLLVPIELTWQARSNDRVLPLLRTMLQRKPEEKFPDVSKEFREQLCMESGAPMSRVNEVIENSFLRARQDVILDGILASPQLDKTLLRDSVLRTLAGYANSPLQNVFDKQFDKARAIRALWARFDMPEELLSEGLRARNILLRAQSDLPPIESVASCARLYGFVDFNLIEDADGTVRSVPLLALWRGRVVPQFALALACLELGVSINNPEQFKASEELIEISPPGRGKIEIPVFTRYGETYKTPIGVSFNVPFYGGSNWAESAKSQGIVHRPLAWVWQIEEWRRGLDSNRATIRRAYEKLKKNADAATPYDENSPDQVQRLLSDKSFKEWLEEAKKDPKEYRVPLEAVATLIQGPEQNVAYRRLIADRLNELRQTVSGKVVIIGMTAMGLSSDSKPTPLHSACPGAVIHGNIYSALMSGVMWAPAAPAWTYLLIVVAGVLATWAMVQVMPREGGVRRSGWRAVFYPFDVRLSPWRATALGVSLMLAWVLFNAVYLFDRKKVVVPLSPPVIAVLLVWAFGTAAIAAERFRVVHALRGYVDRRLVNFLGRHPERDLFEPKRQELTVCFSDLQGFTTLTQTLGERMVPLLQSYLSAMVPVIRSRCGVVNKFMGDGIMFFFGAPDPDPDHVPNAIRCTLEMQAALARFNEEMTAKGFPRLTMRCGINTGPAYVGDAGPDEAREYTALGDTTNVAARLESANKDCGTLILVSDAVRNRVASDQYFFRPVGRLKLRNRKGGVMTYELAGRADQASELERAEAEMMQAMIGAYQAETFGGCIQLLDKMDKAYGVTKLRTRYRERCVEYLAAGTPEGFEGQIIEQD